ncbi:RNA ligase family protein [Kitasatospora fiedleri]|uniref:RNA ligase family protein n=1 Tax=Kitasatospora fiedleri TaxID=2991545 RepID=UPI00249CA58A|nr:RNA ligase family protein [Kitasatospora fiedleri]
MTDFAPEFTAWPKTARLFRDVTITEKLDGTNAGIHISEDGQVVAQSRKRLLTPEADNYGFARWVADNAAELTYILGPGLHFGEWWGAGIQRRYGLTERRFSLFNVDRWFKADPGGTSMCARAEQSSLDDVVDAVPVMYRGPFSESVIVRAMTNLREEGSFAVSGFMNPEGICVYHSQSRDVYKVTLDNNDRGKWEAAA